MKVERLWAAYLCAALANASFQGTSPFFAFTTSSSPAIFSRLSDTPDIIHGLKLSMSVDAIARGCESDTYILVSQPRVSSKDFSHTNATPHLAKRLGHGTGKEQNVKKQIIIPEVIGDVGTSGLREHLRTACKATFTKLDFDSGDIVLPEESDDRTVLTLDLPELPPPSRPKERAAKLAAHDSYLNAIIEHLPSKSYALIFITTALPESLSTPLLQEHTDNVYGPDAWGNWIPVEELHTDLRRQVHDQPRSKRQNKNETDGRALFETYTFLNPGLFMGILVMLILISILSVGISAIAGLQVSYGSFTKEMAQSAKKQ